MSDRFPALGFDPAPGDVAAVDALAAALQRTLQTLGAIRSTLHSFGDPGAVWQGEAARSFTRELTELSPYLEQAERSHRTAHTAAASWADELQRRQLVARELEGRAWAAQRSVLVAGDVAEHAASRVRTALLVGHDVAAAAAVASAAAQRLDAAEQELADLRGRARRLHEEHRVAAARVAAEVRAAAGAAPVAPGTFERLGAALVTAAAFPHGLDDRLAGWCRDNPHVLGEIADVLADATVVAGLIATAVPVTAPVAAGLALATLGTRAVSDRAGADVSASTYVFDGLSVGAGVVGAVAGLAARGGLSVLARGPQPGAAEATAEGGARSGRVAGGADRVGGAGSATSTGTGLVRSDGDDRPFLHFVPDSVAEAAAGVALGPMATGLVSAVDLGREKDRRAAAQAQRDRWNR